MAHNWNEREFQFRAWEANALADIGYDLKPFCGDGTKDLFEQCDDGTAANTDACLDTCIPARCGDGFVWEGREECDDGTNAGGEGRCVPGLPWHPSLRGWRNDGTEECDDGVNDGSGRGLSAGVPEACRMRQRDH